MKIPQEVHLHVRRTSEFVYDSLFQKFSAWSTTWTYLQEDSKSTSKESCVKLYSLSMAAPHYTAVFLQTDRRLCRPKRDGIYEYTCRLDGIYDDNGAVSPDEHDRVAKELNKEQSKYRRASKGDFKNKAPKPDIGIDKIVADRQALRAWKDYVAMHPLSGHEADEARLDKFTCEVFRGRKNLDLHAL